MPRIGTVDEGTVRPVGASQDCGLHAGTAVRIIVTTTLHRDTQTNEILVTGTLANTGSTPATSVILTRAGAAGVLTIAGSYTGGTFSSSTRTVLP